MRILAALAPVLMACSGDLGSPHPHALPVPDGVPALLQPGAKSTRMASYRIEATLDPATHVITGSEHLTWRNDGTRPVDTLPFHLYMNAFKNDESLFMRESHGQMRGVSASPDHYGWIDVASIAMGDQALHPEPTTGADQTTMDVRLPREVQPGETIELDLGFTTQLPEVFARTGFYGAFEMIGQWFPKIGVHKGDDWYCEPFHANAEFFADFGVYDVKLTVPSTQVIAATGVLADAADNGDGTFTLTYHAEDVHDFAFMADPYMEVEKGTAHTAAGDVEVRVYHRPDQTDFARRHLQAGIGSIEVFSQLFVPYPWPIMSIIDPPPGADGASGMEYPTLVVTGGDGWYARDGVRLPEYVTVHEVGHNWFQGMLASNEVDEAWMDEGVNEWADGEVIGQLYGERGGAVDWMDIQLDLDRTRRAVTAPLADIPSPIATASWAFVDNDAYGEATYIKTALALKTLENIVGRDAYLGAMQKFAEQWAFQHPTGKDFFDAISKALDQNLDWFWKPAFEQTGAAAFAVRTAECRPKVAPRGVFGDGDDRQVVLDDKPTGGYECDVVIVNNGTVKLPVHAEARFEDGTTESLDWNDPSIPFFTKTFDRSSPMTEIVIDPDHQILLTDDLLDEDVRLEPDGRASLRAAARVTYWTQTTMQGIGL